MDITRKIEFDAGHRIPQHGSKCRNIHGHRYVLEATLRGHVITGGMAPDEGMVLDFGDLKEIMMRVIGEPWDHAYLAYAYDPVVDMIKPLGEHKTVLFPFIPTVENLAYAAFGALEMAIKSDRMQLYHVRLYETPNCWADVYWHGTT